MVTLCKIPYNSEWKRHIPQPTVDSDNYRSNSGKKKKRSLLELLTPAVLLKWIRNWAPQTSLSSGFKVTGKPRIKGAGWQSEAEVISTIGRPCLLKNTFSKKKSNEPLIIRTCNFSCFILSAVTGLPHRWKVLFFLKFYFSNLRCLCIVSGAKVIQLSLRLSGSCSSWSIWINLGTVCGQNLKLQWPNLNSGSVVHCVTWTYKNTEPHTFTYSVGQNS